jgi:MFS family permease
VFVTASKASAFRVAWSSWGILAFCFFLAFIHRTSIGTVNNEITTAFGLSRTTFGVMASMYFYAYMIMQIPAGLLADNWGPRKTVATGALIGGAATFLFGNAANPAMLFIGRFFIGIGMATVFVCLMKIQSQWFPSKMFATLSGFSIFLGNLGGAAGQFPFALLALYIGWQNSYLVIALVTVVSGIVCFLMVRNKPEDIGLPSLNSQNEISEKKMGLIEGIRIVLREKRIYGPIAFYLFNQAAFLSFVGAWLVPWLREVHRMDTTTAANFGMLAVIGIMIGSAGSGVISDKLKRRKAVIITGAIICACSWGLIAVWKTTDFFIIGSLLFAMGLSSGVFPLAMAVTKEVSPISLTGTAISILNTLGFLGIASATSLLGFIADYGEYLSQTVRFNNVLIACFIISASSLISSFFCYETYPRNVSVG